MKYVDLPLASPAANLACDEALLEMCECGAEHEILRFWESKEHFAVVGYANSAAREVNLEACKADGVPVLRRLTGGGAVLQGPGCLNYSVILKIPGSGPLASITGTNKTVLEKQRVALEPLIGGTVAIKGQTDLALGALKISGNAQRRKKRFLIFHGTFLLNFNIALIEKYLLMPSKEPDYRANRSHGQFLTNIGLEANIVKEALRAEWRAVEGLRAIPVEKVAELAENKYSTEGWNLKL
jgi:lipoate-protein ligase A